MKTVMCDFNKVRVLVECGSVVDIETGVRDGLSRNCGRFLAAVRDSSVLRNLRATTRHSDPLHRPKYTGRSGVL
jgi:hypothetical protein